ncbi:hypothetical protein QVD17_06753 [Tagetes erecta]|uniref:Uncharacterized protein n=1 Tax=Tagetes erecta TaxID=13708 RepID=A0AAD8LHH8_TARER|nr:hypothetical protein QVD17_06753 [Tagetes erecta]
MVVVVVGNEGDSGGSSGGGGYEDEEDDVIGLKLIQFGLQLYSISSNYLRPIKFKDQHNQTTNQNRPTLNNGS